MSTPVVENHRAVRTFVAYRVVSRGYFHLSILFVYLLTRDHSVLEVALVLGSYGLALAALTPVSSRLVARLGPVRALIAGEVLKAAGLVLLAVGAASVPVAVFAQVVNALGFALAMSADTTVINRLAGPARVRSLQASTQSWMFVSLLVSGVAGGALYLVDPRLPLAAGAAAALAAAGLALTLPRNDAAPAGVAGAPSAPPSDTARRMTAPEIRWVTYYVLTRGFMLGSFIGLLPYLVFQRLDVDVLGLSLVLGSYTLAAFVTARYSQQILRRAGQRTVAVATGVVLLLSLVVFAVSTSLAAVVLAMILLGAASGGVRPATLGELSRAAAEHRGGAVPGWLLSRMEGAFGLCNAVVVLAGGVVIQFWSFPAAMLALAVLYVLVQAVTTVVANRASVDTAITYS